MKSTCSIAAVAALLCTVQTHAAGPSSPRYRIHEISSPAAMHAPCLAGYAASAFSTRVNDFGVMSANFLCYKSVDPVNGFFEQTGGTFVGATWFDSFELPKSGNTAFSYGVNNLGQVFGGDAPGPIYGVRWSIAGGLERVFDEPSCEGLNIGGATSGNGRYIVGWGLRTDPALGPPYDTLCITEQWLIRAPSGVVTTGLLRGSASDINVFDLAVGFSDLGAVRVHVPTGQVRVLHPAVSDREGATAVDINDLGEIAGYTFLYPETEPVCAHTVALRWERNGSERVLPLLPGDVSGHAFAVGYDGETVGDSSPKDDCRPVDSEVGRAVLWRGNKVIDLNTLIPAGSHITLTSAGSVNRLGQILAVGFATDEPFARCATTDFDPDTGMSRLRTYPCPNLRAYLLTPAGR